MTQEMITMIADCKALQRRYTYLGNSKTMRLVIVFRLWIDENMPAPPRSPDPCSSQSDSNEPRVGKHLQSSLPAMGGSEQASTVLGANENPQTHSLDSTLNTMVKKSKSNQIPPEWTYIFHKLYAQGVDPRTLLPPTVPAGTGPSPAEETPDTSIEVASAPLFPSDTPNLTATSSDIPAAASVVPVVKITKKKDKKDKKGSNVEDTSKKRPLTEMSVSIKALQPAPQKKSGTVKPLSPLRPNARTLPWNQYRCSHPGNRAHGFPSHLKKVHEMDENVPSASKTKNK
ncbi:hypothetical protein JB92DRAFT_3097541 [Gautieria morchelliformis]|nr:hypothetical protein JB92DRAFT_3097541 [Gautieria morchelliformis]